MIQYLLLRFVLLSIVIAGSQFVQPQAALAQAAMSLTALLKSTHVHGLAVDRAQPARLLIATHNGLYALNLDTRMVEPRSHVFDDFMGFAVNPAEPEMLLASGHSARGGNLGFIASADGGKSWKQISPGSDGPVDFHQMAISPANPSVIYGIHGALQRSNDGGRSWTVVGSAPERTIALAGSALGADVLYAGTEGGIFVSRDGGRRWDIGHMIAAPTTAFEAAPGGLLHAYMIGQGLLRLKENDFPRWRRIAPEIQGGPILHIATDRSDPSRMFAATARGDILSSIDGGCKLVFPHCKMTDPFKRSINAMQVVIFEAEQYEATAFDALKAEHELILVPEPLRSANADKFAEADAISTFIYSALDRVVLERLPSLRLIATRSTGFDHIDTAYCAERGVLVSNVPTYGDNTVAEHVFALLLTISHRMLEAVERARNGPFSPQGLQGFDLAGKTLGVVGTGRIGRRVIQIARGFEMNIVACDLKPDDDLAERLGFRYARFEEVLAAADIVTLHVPATSENHLLLSDKELARMKHGVVLINTARGDLIDPRALIQALRRGTVTAAGLDVLPDEPAIREEAELICSIFCEQHEFRSLVADHVLIRMPNVVVTPHTAFNTREAVHRIAETTLANITAFAKGRPQNVVPGPVVAASR